MASIEKLPSGRWRAKIFIGRDANGKRCYKTFSGDSKKEVKNKAIAMELEMQRKEDEPLNITVGEAIDRYIQDNTNILAPDTIKEYKSLRKNRLQSLMNIPLRKITREKVRQAVNIDAQRLSPKTVKNAHGLLSATLNVYHPTFVLKTALPKKKVVDKYIPTDADIAVLLQATKGSEIYVPILLAATLSLRRSEVCGLRWKDIDLKANRLTVKTAVVINDKNEWVTKDPKTFTSYRKLTIPPILSDELKKAENKKEFVTDLNPGQITNRFTRQLKKLSIPKFRFHDLRHYNASVMLALHLPDKYAMERGGWSDINTLKKIYQHIFEEKQSSYDPIIGEYFSRFS